MSDRLQHLEHLASVGVRRLPRGRRGVVPSCVHLPGADVHTGKPTPGTICVQHPDRVWCSPCMADHLAGHDWAEEHRCDWCGTHDDEPWGYSTFRRVRLRNLAGDVLSWPVAVGGFGLCADCQAVAAEEVAR